MDRLDARPRLYEDAAEAIRSYIGERGLGPGDSLPSERQIQAQLGISRASVREALRVLQMMGLIEARQGKGLFVTAIDLKPMVDAYLGNLALVDDGSFTHLLELREILEIGAVDLAARVRTPDDLSAMSAALDHMQRRVERREDALDDDLRFHDLLIQATHNPLLDRLYSAIAPFLREVRHRAIITTERRTHNQAHDWTDAWREHTTIFRAIADAEPNLAVQVMHAHLDGIRHDLWDDRTGDNRIGPPADGHHAPVQTGSAEGGSDD